MTLSWALAGFEILGSALLFSRIILRRGSAALRHLILGTAFVALLISPLVSAAMSRLQPVRQMRSAVVLVINGTKTARKPSVAAPFRIDPFALTAWLWFGGTVLLLGRIVFALDFRRRYSEPASEAMQTLGAELAQKLRLRNRVRFEQSTAVLVAETRGLLRPVVTLPANADNWPEERRRLVLMHELLHIVRGDWFFTVLAEAVAAVHWFNPLAWIALRDLRREREVACGDAVLSYGVNGCDYAAHLVQIVSGLGRRQSAPSVAMAQTSHLETRIRSILKPDSPRGGITMKANLGAAAFAACLLTVVSTVQSPAQSGAAAISGTVMDASSARVPNASVIVRNAETRKAEILRSNETGEFTFSAIPAGTYTIEVAKAGFQLFKQENLVLAPGSAQNVTVLLNLGRINETVNVTGQGASAKAQPADTNKPPLRLRIGGGVQAAKLVKQVRPEYPPHLKTAGVEGTVLMEAVISREGTLRNLQVLNSMVHSDLIQAATDSVRQWQWEPTYLNGQPVEIVTQITINFTLAK